MSVVAAASPSQSLESGRVDRAYEQRGLTDAYIDRHATTQVDAAALASGNALVVLTAALALGDRLHRRATRPRSDALSGSRSRSSTDSYRRHEEAVA